MAEDLKTHNSESDALNKVFEVINRFVSDDFVKIEPEIIKLGIEAIQKFSEKEPELAKDLKQIFVLIEEKQYKKLEPEIMRKGIEEISELIDRVKGKFSAKFAAKSQTDGIIR